MTKISSSSVPVYNLKSHRKSLRTNCVNNENLNVRAKVNQKVPISNTRKVRKKLETKIECKFCKRKFLWERAHAKHVLAHGNF